LLLTLMKPEWKNGLTTGGGCLRGGETLLIPTTVSMILALDA